MAAPSWCAASVHRPPKPSRRTASRRPTARSMLVSCLCLAWLLILFQDDVTGNALQVVLLVAQLFQRRLQITIVGLTRGVIDIVQQSGVPLGAVVDPQLERPDHLEFRQLVDERLILRIVVARRRWRIFLFV